MGQFDRLLQRHPQIDAAVVEEVRARAMARLSVYSDPRPATEAAESDDGLDGPGDWDSEGHVALEAEAPIDVRADAALARDAALSAAAAQIEIVVVDHVEPIVLPSFDPWRFPDGDAADDVAPAPIEARSFEEYEPPLITPMRRPADDPPGSNGHSDANGHSELNGHADLSGYETLATGLDGHPDPSDGADEIPVDEANGAARNGTAHAAPPSRSTRRQPAKRRAAASRAVATAYCPYCALPLEPPPTSDRQCTRCRQRIMVRRVAGGMVVHLTEAALEVFDAEREREASVERCTNERRKWLELAGSAGAPAPRLERLERAAISEEAVQTARALYIATVDHAVDEALRRDRWEEAARHRRGQADALRRLTGRHVAPSEEVRDLYREAARIELRGIATMARTAAVIGSRCCDACRADEGAAFRIAAELRATRLPHDDCSKDLCRCRWDLTPRDVRMVQRYLQRVGRLRTDAAVPDAAPDPPTIAESAPG
jgi:hypothetical protein